MKEILNAKIASTVLGTEDHGVMTCYITLEGAGWGCSYGGYVLDNWDESRKRRVGSAEGLDAIMTLMETLEVRKWEDIKGQYVRCETTGWGGNVTKIGHLLKDKWFSFEEFFSVARG